jgi:hypothetical protein
MPPPLPSVALLPEMVLLFTVNSSLLTIPPPSNVSLPETVLWVSVTALSDRL